MHLYNIFEMRTLELAERSVEGAEAGGHGYRQAAGGIIVLEL